MAANHEPFSLAELQKIYAVMVTVVLLYPEDNEHRLPRPMVSYQIFLCMHPSDVFIGSDRGFTYKFFTYPWRRDVSYRRTTF